MIKFNWDKVHRPDNTPIISDMEIENLVEGLLGDYKPELLERPMPVTPEHFAEAYLELSIDYQRIFSPEDNVVGTMVFNNEYLPVYGDDGEVHRIRIPANTIVIHEATACDDKLQAFMRFTILHECGHAWMHGRVYRRNPLWILLGNKSSQMVKCFRSSLTECRKLTTEADFREHQANVFAAAVAMPRATFVPYANQLLKAYGLAERLSVESSNEYFSICEAYSALLADLAETYKVSLQAADIRLHKLGLVDSEITLVS